MESSEPKTDMVSEKEARLIDFLYKDTYRIDSYLAQITNGILHDVRLKNQTSQDSSFTMEGNVKIARISKTGKELTEYLTEQEINPHDHNVIELIDALDLPPLPDIPVEASGQLVHLQGYMSIRDYQTLADLVPFITKNHRLFNLADSNKSISEICKIFTALKKIVPLNLEVELMLDSGKSIRGILKKEYLLSNPEDILVSYGTHMPGKWHIIGILDHNAPTAPKDVKHSSSLRNGLDEMAKACKVFYESEQGSSTIMPLVIFRELSK